MNTLSISQHQASSYWVFCLTFLIAKWQRSFRCRMFQLQYQNAKSTAFRISRLSNSWVLHRGPHRSWIGWKTWHQVQISKIHTSKLKTSNESDDSSPCWTAYRQDFEDPWQLTLENMHLRLRKTDNPMTTLPVRTKSPIPVHEEVAVVVNKKPGFQHRSTSTVFGAFRGPDFPRAGINLFSIPKETKSGHVDLSLWCTWWSAAVPNPSFLTCTHLCIRLKDLESISETKRHVVIFIIWNHQTLPENFVPRMDKLGVDQHKPRCPKDVFGCGSCRGDQQTTVTWVRDEAGCGYQFA